MKKIKIGYFADGPWAHQAFKKLNDDESIDIAFICPRFDYRDPYLVELGNNNNIDVIYEKNVNSSNTLLKIKDYGCDILVSMSFNQIFKKDIIDLADLGLINCHAGKLPFYRGRNILNWALINDEKEFGITVHYVDEGIDTGDIILQRVFPITDEDNYGSLLERAYVECANTLYDAIKDIQYDRADRIKQTIIHPVGMYCGMRRAGDEIINWNQTSRELFNFVRAITKPGPCALSVLRGEEIKIIQVQMIPDSPVYKGIPGQVVGKDPTGFYVKTIDTVIKVVKFESSLIPRVGDRFE